MVPFFFKEQLPKSAKKVILLKKCLKKYRFLTRTFQKYWPQNREKNLFLIFDLVHVDVKLHEDSESDLIFTNFPRKNDQKQRFIARFGYIPMHSKMWKLVINGHFWPLLREKLWKMRSDSESSCNFTSTCTKSKIKNQFFPWFRGQSF